MKIMIDDEFSTNENGEVQFNNNSKTKNQGNPNGGVSINGNENYNVFLEVREEGDCNSTPENNNYANSNNIHQDYSKGINENYSNNTGDYCCNRNVENGHNFTNTDNAGQEYFNKLNNLDSNLDSNLNNSCTEELNQEKGHIIVCVKLGSKDGVELKGAKVNLYMLNGVSPRLCESKLTDSEGKVIFDNLDDGCYRVISIVDRRYFEKPCYINWNEVIIDSNVKEATVCVVNRIKACCCRK